MTIYKIEKWIPGTGRGEDIAYCLDKSSVISYLTNNGRSHRILTNEFDAPSNKRGNNEVDIYNRCVLRLIPDENYYNKSDFDEPFDFLKPETEYFIIFEIEVYEKNESKAC